MTRNTSGPKRPRNPGPVSDVTQYVVPDSFTSSLLHFNGPNDVQLFTDEIGGRVWTAGNNARLSTSQLKFGESSAIFNTTTSDYLMGDGNASMAFGSGDFTIDFWVRPSSTFAQNHILVDFRPTSTNGAYPTFFIRSSDVKFVYYTNSAARLVSTTTPVSGTWHHIAITRASGTTRMFINGVQEGGTYADTTVYLNPANRPVLSSDGISVGTFGLNGWIDEFRISKGVARWTANFTPPTAQYT